MQLQLVPHVAIVASTLAFKSDPQADVPAQASIGTGCTSAPVTHDAAIWSLAIWTDVAGSTPIVESLQMYTVSTRPGHVFVPIMQNVSPFTLRVHDHEYTSTPTGTLGRVVWTFGPMTLAEMADFVDALGGSATFQAALQSATASLTVIDLTKPDPSKPDDQFWEDEVLTKLGLTAAEERTPAGFAVRLGTLAALKPQAVSATGQFTSITAANVSAVKQSLQTFGGRQPGNGTFFVIDEPCLQLGISPFVAPTGTTTAASTTAISFRGRYDFYSPKGRGFLKLRGEGDGAATGSYYDRVEATADFGMNSAASARSILSLGGSGSYAVKRDGNDRIDTVRGTAKAKWQGPNLAGIFGALPGGGTTPLASAEFGVISGTGAANATTDWIGRFDFSLTGRFTRRLSVDLKTFGAMSGTPRFGGFDRFAYRAIQFRFNVNKDWDYLVKYECGRKDPDYKDFCGTQSGLAMTVGR
jgi:hypothetical protein